MTRSLSRLRAAQDLWEGTKYLSGSEMPKQGVDCVRYSDKLEQAYLGLELPPLPRYAQDAAFHDKKIVAQMQRLLIERFNLVDVEGKYEPADLIVGRQITKQEGSIHHPHHIMIVGHDRRTLWDAWPGIGVRKMGIGALGTSFELLRHWRSTL